MVAFNTLEAYERLVKSGFPKEQAHAIVELLGEIIKEPKTLPFKSPLLDMLFPWIMFAGFLLFAIGVHILNR